MVAELSAFAPVAGWDGIFVAERANLRCVAVRLGDGSLCLYNPVAGTGAAAQESLVALGTVSYLLTPNHYHNKALAEITATYPEAVLCCSADAQGRLERITGLSFSGLEGLRAALPDGVELIQTEGLKTGEVWIAARVEAGVAWLVGDAFCGPKSKLGAVVETAQMLGTFPSYAVGDGPAYLRWLAGRVEAGAPSMIIPCHGAMIRRKAVYGDLCAVAEAVISDG